MTIRGRTDIANAERLLSLYGPNIRYCPPWAEWAIWEQDEGLWKRDEQGTILQYAGHTARSIYDEIDEMTAQARPAAQAAREAALTAQAAAQAAAQAVAAFEAQVEAAHEQPGAMAAQASALAAQALNGDAVSSSAASSLAALDVQLEEAREEAAQAAAQAARATQAADQAAMVKLSRAELDPLLKTAQAAALEAQAAHQRAVTWTGGAFIRPEVQRPPVSPWLPDPFNMGEKDLEREIRAHVKHAEASESLRSLRAMVAFAATHPSVYVTPESFDPDVRAINLENGYYNLRDFTLYRPAREYGCSRRAGVRYVEDANCPIWHEFLKVVMDGNEELISYLQRGFGYSLTGEISEQKLFICLGSGQNGKSVCLNVLKLLMGMYAGTTDFETFVSRPSDGKPRNDVARLQGLRVILSSEIDRGRKLGEALIKSMTGGEPITARFLNREFFEFVLRGKIWISANDRPRIEGQDFGIWRRVDLIPWNVTIPEHKKDPFLLEKLKQELPGILNWAIMGYYEWTQGGLRTPDAVKASTKEYQTDSDLFAAWISECCVTGREGLRGANQDLYLSFESWALRSGEKRVSKRALGIALKERGYEEAREAHSRGRKGIELTAGELVRVRAIEAARAAQEATGQTSFIKGGG